MMAPFFVLLPFLFFFFSFPFFFHSINIITDHKMKKALPFEILQEVFAQLSFSDQLTCQTVCKAWSRAAVTCANKSLVIYGSSGVHLLAPSLLKVLQIT